MTLTSGHPKSFCGTKRTSPDSIHHHPCHSEQVNPGIVSAILNTRMSVQHAKRHASDELESRIVVLQSDHSLASRHHGSGVSLLGRDTNPSGVPCFQAKHGVDGAKLKILENKPLLDTIIQSALQASKRDITTDSFCETSSGESGPSDTIPFGRCRS